MKMVFFVDQACKLKMAGYYDNNNNTNNTLFTITNTNPETEDPEVIPIKGPPTSLHLNTIYN